MSDHDDPKTTTGAEGEASNDVAVPFQPKKDDDTPVGDTDQHSKVDHSKDPADAVKPSNAATD